MRIKPMRSKRIYCTLNNCVLTTLTLLIFLVSCDENSNNVPQPTPVPTPTPECVCLSEDPDYLLDFEDCPTDGLVELCNPYTCFFDENSDPMSPQQFSGAILFSDCEVIDCFNIICEFEDEANEQVEISTIIINGINFGDNPFGRAEIEGVGGDYRFGCIPVVP